jgi:hypothetical protein
MSLPQNARCGPNASITLRSGARRLANGYGAVEKHGSAETLTKTLGCGASARTLIAIHG